MYPVRQPKPHEAEMYETFTQMPLANAGSAMMESYMRSTRGHRVNGPVDGYFRTTENLPDLPSLQVLMKPILIGIAPNFLHFLNTKVFPSANSNKQEWTQTIVEFSKQDPTLMPSQGVAGQVSRTKYQTVSRQEHYGLNFEIDGNTMTVEEGAQTFIENMLFIQGTFATHLAKMAVAAIMNQSKRTRARTIGGIPSAGEPLSGQRIGGFILERDSFAAGQKTLTSLMQIINDSKYEMMTRTRGVEPTAILFPPGKHGLIRQNKFYASADVAGPNGPDIFTGKSFITEHDRMQIHEIPRIEDDTDSTSNGMKTSIVIGNMFVLETFGDQDPENLTWKVYSTVSDDRDPISVESHIAALPWSTQVVEGAVLDTPEALSQAEGVRASLMYSFLVELQKASGYQTIPRNRGAGGYDDVQGFGAILGAIQNIMPNVSLQMFNAGAGETVTEIMDEMVRWLGSPCLNDTPVGTAAQLNFRQYLNLGRAGLGPREPQGASETAFAQIFNLGPLDNPNNVVLGQYVRLDTAEQRKTFMTEHLKRVDPGADPSVFTETFGLVVKSIWDQYVGAAAAAFGNIPALGAVPRNIDPVLVESWEAPLNHVIHHLTIYTWDVLKNIMRVMKQNPAWRIKSTYKVLAGENQMTHNILECAAHVLDNGTSDTDNVYTVDINAFHATFSDQHMLGRRDEETPYTRAVTSPLRFKEEVCAAHTAKTFHKTLKCVGLRPIENQSMQSGAMVAGGKETGMTIVRDPLITQGQDSNSQVLNVTYTQYCGVHVFIPDRVIVMENLFYAGVGGGSNLRYVTLEDARRHSDNAYIVENLHDASVYPIFTSKNGVKPTSPRRMFEVAHGYDNVANDIEGIGFWTDVYFLNRATQMISDDSENISVAPYLWNTTIEYFNRQGVKCVRAGNTHHGQYGEQRGVFRARHTGNEYLPDREK